MATSSSEYLIFDRHVLHYVSGIFIALHKFVHPLRSLYILFVSSMWLIIIWRVPSALCLCFSADRQWNSSDAKIQNCKLNGKTQSKPWRTAFVALQRIGTSDNIMNEIHAVFCEHSSALVPSSCAVSSLTCETFYKEDI